jgi:hypothetical protein
MPDQESKASEEVNIRLIRAILEHNEILSDRVRRRIYAAIAKMQVRLIGSADTGMNLGTMNADGISAQSAEFTLLKPTYELKRIKHWTISYDQLVYPSIFWNGTGICRAIDAETMQGLTKRIRKVLICLMVQPRDHFI